MRLFLNRAADVENGVCLYSTLENGQESKTLLQAEIAQIEDVKSGKAPFGEACKRCENANNYDEVDGLCTCTPACGSCAPNAKEDHDAKLSGKFFSLVGCFLCRQIQLM